MLRLGPYEIQGYVYDVKDMLAPPPPLAKGLARRPGKPTERVAVPYRVTPDGRVKPGDNAQRKTIALHVGRRTLRGLLAPTENAGGRLYVQWECACGAGGVMSAREWAKRASKVALVGPNCQYCAAASRRKAS